MNQGFINRELKDLRKVKNVGQEDLAEKLGIPRTTYAYKEKTGSFTDTEKALIAKILKVDMTTISWTRPIFQGMPGTENMTIQQLRDEILKLQEKVKTQEEFIKMLMEKR